MHPTRLRWAALAVFVIASSLNYLDRQILAALAPLISAEFHLTNQDYGYVLAAFSIVYMAAAPAAGWFIDRVGLNRGISISVAFWSLAGAATGAVSSLGGLLGTRAALGLAEAGGVPATGKALRLYLLPRERAFGNAISQLGLSVGAMAAPLLATGLALRYGWRSAFVVPGLLGLAWIPLWNWTARRIPPVEEPGSGQPRASLRTMTRDLRLWGLVAANVLGMTCYTLWTNWTTIFLVREHHLTLPQAAWLAWLPPLAFNLGGLVGGWLSWRGVAEGGAANPVRRRICYVSAAALLPTVLVPSMPAAGAAIALICLSAFFSSAYSVNLYSIPLDAFPPGNAAFGVACLTAAYGAMQTVFSPLAGRLIDSHGFQPVCLIAAILPLGGAVILYATRGAE
ncbi:MAG: MFS transporter [Acidobacteria bacterium]|nr:MFS transporter [Acidobacteriota bacterium]